jgi:hypothetical protein
MDKNGYADMTADDYDDRPDAKWLQHICNYFSYMPKMHLLTYTSEHQQKRRRISSGPCQIASQEVMVRATWKIYLDMTKVPRIVD